MAALVVVLVLCLAGLNTLVVQVRCIDAAREAARLAARGDDRAAELVARTVGPAGAGLDVRRGDGRVVARIVARAPLLPGLTITAEAVAAAEPGSP